MSLYLRCNAVVLGCCALALLALPPSKTAGPSMTVLYQFANRAHLGIGMLCTAAGVWLSAYRWPHLGLAGLMVVQTFWTLALTAPAVLGHRANLVAPVGWAGLTVTTALILQLRRGRG